MTIDDWIVTRRAQGHIVAVIISDRTSGENILTTINPLVIAHVQHSEGASIIKIKA